MFKEKIKEQISNGWNVHDFLKDKSVEEINDWCSEKRRNFNVCCLSITGELNISSIIRTSHCFGVKTVFIIGRRFYDKRGNVGAQNYTEIIRIGGLDSNNNIDSEIFRNTMYEYNMFPIFVETGGQNLTGWTEWANMLCRQQANKTPCFVFGSEGSGIPQSILDMTEEFNSFIVSIPQAGALRSLNVSAAASIVLWDFIKEMYL